MPEFAPIEDAWLLTGATASAKTQVGIELARLLDAEIVSLDSMAVYRGMDIGTAKPTADERQGVPHHLIDVVDPTEDFSIAEYLTAAHAVVGEIRSRGHTALFVGGTPLYLKALLSGLASGPEPNWEMRERLAAEAEAVGGAALHDRLAELDAAAAAKLHPNDTKRVIRALEVYEATGRPISANQIHFEDQPDCDSRRVVVLDWPREVLYQRINCRVDEMFDAGFEDEVRDLLAKSGRFSRTAAQGVGYREVIELLNGETELAAALDRVKTRTRQFAKRQLTWFRSLDNCHWIEVAEPLDAGRVATEILQRVGEA
jgi:tRNA dimethylallyltransferase